MLDHEDVKWIAATTTELNTQLQQVSRYCDLARQQQSSQEYLNLLDERVLQATKLAQALFDRVTSRILAGKSVGTGTKTPDTPGSPVFSVVPPPAPGAATPPPPPRASSPPPPPPVIAPKPKPPPPVAAPKQPPIAAASEEIPTEIKVRNPKGARELVLIVDDEQDILESAAMNLTDEGYRVIVARDGFEALRIYQQISKQVNLVILDFFLPVMDGDAVFEELRALNPNVNVVLSSGFAEQNKIGMMLAQGLRGFIPKPYTREKLLEQVRSLLDSSRMSAR